MNLIDKIIMWFVNMLKKLERGGKGFSVVVVSNNSLGGGGGGGRKCKNKGGDNWQRCGQ